MGNKLTKKMFGGITFLTISIETKRKRLLKDPDVVDMLRIFHIDGQQGGDFETLYNRLKSSNK